MKDFPAEWMDEKDWRDKPQPSLNSKHLSFLFKFYKDLKYRMKVRQKKMNM